MDKRYLLILIIIVVCCINLSFIVINSDVVGSASVSVGKYIFSMPEGFSLSQDNGNSVVIQNGDGVVIYLESDLSESDTYAKRLVYIENETDDEILSEGSINVSDISVDVVFFQSTNNTNKSTFYFEKDNVPFKMVMSGFNYNADRNQTLDYATFIIQSLHKDYKSKQ